MSRLSIWVLAAFGLWAGCQVAPPSNELTSRIASAELELAPMLESEFDALPEQGEALVQSLLRDYATYANAHHGDSLALQYSMKRADLLLAKGEAEAAVQQWIDIVGAGGGEALASEAMFRIGLAREATLADTIGALKAYSELLRLYPESRWAEAAGEAAKWLTFNEREFIRALESGAEARQ